MHFGIVKGTRGPLEAIFRKGDFKPLVFGTFGEMSDAVKKVLKNTIDYGADHLGRSMAPTTVETARASLKRRYKTRLSMEEWIGYAKLLFDRTKYVGTNVPIEGGYRGIRGDVLGA
jgi:hypothetical protein